MKPFSEYAMHVQVGEQDVPTTVQQAIGRSMGSRWVKLEYDDDDATIPHQIQKLTPNQLLRLGSVWYLSRDDFEHNKQHKDNPNLLTKPKRLTLQDAAALELETGDYLRIHHTPRRFDNVYRFRWQEDTSTTSSSNTVVVRSDPTSGFWIVDKPPLIPVHATVDNQLENVVHQLQVANPSYDYVTPAQRIDVNTSGLLVVATKPEFAAYFAALLRNKTQHHQSATIGKNNIDRDEKTAKITKGYRCLVCLQQDDSTNSSVLDRYQELHTLVNTTIRHYLEPSDRAPKRFSSRQHEDGSWLECRLEITGLSDLIPLVHGGMATTIATTTMTRSLWTNSRVPSDTKAICQLDIRLQTGRTHQIRGQLAALGFPIVGDEQYGGAIPMDGGDDDKDNNSESSSRFISFPQKLALQCSHLGFYNVDYSQKVWSKKKRKDIVQGRPSRDNWVSVTLDRAWWTDIVQQQQATTQNGGGTATTSRQDFKQIQKQQNSMEASNNRGGNQQTIKERPDLLPPKVQLSPGRHKYVLVKVLGSQPSRSQKQKENACDDKIGMQDTRTTHWFVRSASVEECGGPYHSNVAEDLIEWIQAAGYEKIVVTGGGRIDYVSSSNSSSSNNNDGNQIDDAPARAHVYGFSYGYGKGDHARVAELIATETGILATYDDSNNLY